MSIFLLKIEHLVLLDLAIYRRLAVSSEEIQMNLEIFVIILSAILGIVQLRRIMTNIVAVRDEH